MLAISSCQITISKTVFCASCVQCGNKGYYNKYCSEINIKFLWVSETIHSFSQTQRGHFIFLIISLQR